MLNVFPDDVTFGYFRDQLKNSKKGFFIAIVGFLLIVFLD
ncbi:hypothetical protein LEP1GSC100_0125 [Leptospira interrogans serovar Bataviae str. UI 08561]|nr:hypothetical protein LEP1GSC100_0125 [Leptospira interrogans serovar Bataviae str. UI 08561]